MVQSFLASPFIVTFQVTLTSAFKPPVIILALKKEGKGGGGYEHAESPPAESYSVAVYH